MRMAVFSGYIMRPSRSVVGAQMVVMLVGVVRWSARPIRMEPGH